MRDDEFSALPDGVPAGLPVGPHRGSGGPDRMCFWASDEPLVRMGGHWRRLFDERRRLGLYPLLLEYLPGDIERPWQRQPPNGFRYMPPEAIDALDASSVLRRLGRVSEVLTGVDELAAPGEVRGGPDEYASVLADACSEQRAWFLGLCRAASGAHALTLVGWDGAANHTGVDDVAAVLRSWEGRFGARVVALGSAELWLSVAAPPMTLDHARAVAAEHEALCPDNIWQGPGDFEEYVEMLVGRRVWSFWWD